MTLPYYYFLSFFFHFVPRRFIVSFCLVSFSHPLALFLFFRSFFASCFCRSLTRHVIFQLNSLWLYVYVSRGNMARFLYMSYFSPYIRRPSVIESGVSSCRTFVERHRYFTLNCCHCHCGRRFRAEIHLSCIFFSLASRGDVRGIVLNTERVAGRNSDGQRSKRIDRGLFSLACSYTNA